MKELIIVLAGIIFGWGLGSLLNSLVQMFRS